MIEIAIASTLASWTEANSPWIRKATESAKTSVAGSRMAITPSDARNAANCAPSTHGFRRPIGDPWIPVDQRPPDELDRPGDADPGAKAAITSGSSFRCAR